MSTSNELLAAGWLCIVFEIISFIAAALNNFDFTLNGLGILFTLLSILFFISAGIVSYSEFKRRMRKLSWKMKIYHNQRVDEEVEKEMSYCKKYNELTDKQKKEVHNLVKNIKY